MKGQTKVEVAGEEVTLKFTLGVSEDMQAYAEKEGLDNAEDDPKGTRVMFALMELYATDDEWLCDSEEILEKAEEAAIKYKALGVDQIQTINSIVEEATENIEGAEAGNPTKGKAKS